MEKTFVLLDSITDAGPEHRDVVAVSGSHGGLYPAAMASRAGLRAVILNDAGIGLDRAGVAGVMALDTVGMAAAAADCLTCRIGSAADMIASGRISVVNASARTLGVAPGMPVTEAAGFLEDAPAPADRLPAGAEARRKVSLPRSGTDILLVDSASLVRPSDAGAVILTGSHGGLIGGAPERALKAEARIAAFNDAGGGKDDVGFGRLPALDGRGIATVTVSHDTARIGDAGSTLETGVISRMNWTAERLGAQVGQRLLDWLEMLAR